MQIIETRNGNRVGPAAIGDYGLPALVRAALLAFPERLFIAGGFLRDTLTDRKPKDIDLWMTDDAIQNEVDRFLTSHPSTLHRTYGASVITFVPQDARPPAQLVFTRVGPIEEVIRTFDFTVCQVALVWSGYEWRFEAGKDFERDLRVEEIIWTGSDDGHAGRSVRRMVDLASRGWKVSDRTVSDVVRAVIKQTVGDPDSPIVKEIHYSKESA